MVKRPRISRRRLRCIALATLIAVPPWARGDEPSRENQIKAALVYKVVKFVEWPADAVPRSSATPGAVHGRLQLTVEL